MVHRSNWLLLREVRRRLSAPQISLSDPSIWFLVGGQCPCAWLRWVLVLLNYCGPKALVRATLCARCSRDVTSNAVKERGGSTIVSGLGALACYDALLIDVGHWCLSCTCGAYEFGREWAPILWGASLAMISMTAKVVTVEKHEWCLLVSLMVRHLKSRSHCACCLCVENERARMGQYDKFAAFIIGNNYCVYWMLAWFSISAIWIENNIHHLRWTMCLQRDEL